MIKEGTRWSGGDEKIFRVKKRIELDGNIWIHYILENKEDIKEFSCYEESFLSRFRQLPE
jgi:hypothetical protein